MDVEIVKADKFLSLTVSAKLLYEMCNLNQKSIKRYKVDEERLTLRDIIVVLLDPNSKEDQKIKQALFNARDAHKFVSVLKKYRRYIKQKASSIIQNTLETIEIPNDLHSPEEMFFFKIQTLFIALDALLAIYEIEDMEIEERLLPIVRQTLDAVAPIAIEEVNAIERRVRERSFPSELYYLWYFLLVQANEELTTFLIGEWREQKLLELLENTLQDVDFSNKTFGKTEEEKAMLEHLARTGLVTREPMDQNCDTLS